MYVHFMPNIRTAIITTDWDYASDKEIVWCVVSNDLFYQQQLICNIMVHMFRLNFVEWVFYIQRLYTYMKWI